MILVAVGTQLPFDRLVMTVDDWAVRTDRSDVVAQIGPSVYSPRRLNARQFVPPDEFLALQSAADVVIAHAGMGSIISALELGKPILVMPRDHKRGEHRNAHQLATALRFRDRPGIHVAMNEEELADWLQRIEQLKPASASPHAPQLLLGRLRAFVEEAPRRRELERPSAPPRPAE